MNESLPIGELYYGIANKGEVEISTLRKFEKLTVKVTTHESHVGYFDKCIELNLIPEFLKFKLPKLDIYKDARIYYAKAVTEQRKLVASKLRAIKNEYNNIFSLVKSQLSDADFGTLTACIDDQVVKKSREEQRKRHNTKIYALWKKQRPPVPECIVNRSSRVLSLSEQNALLFGLNHSILPSKINPTMIRADIDSQITRICKFNEIDLSYDSKHRIREATDRFVHEAEHTCNTKKNQMMHRTLRALSKDQQIRLCKMDKGVGAVILNTADYYAKLDVIINDKSRFKKLDYNIPTNRFKHCFSAPWISKEDSVQRCFRKHIKPLVDEKVYKRIYPNGSQPGRLYGMAKIHKTDCPMRPVLSAINTPEYNLSKWLEVHLKPFLNDKYSVNSSTEFVEQLSQLQPTSIEHCVSFDIKSLYTHVPLKEVIEDIIKTVYSEAAPTSVFRTSKTITDRVLRNMLYLCSESIFIYKDSVYKQIDGVAMGSPLAPLLANWFVCKVENTIFNQDLACKPVFYRRYVDDIFALFCNKDEMDRFHSILNDAHLHLSFTKEMANNILPFPGHSGVSAVR